MTALLSEESRLPMERIICREGDLAGRPQAEWPPRQMRAGPRLEAAGAKGSGGIRLQGAVWQVARSL
jgi:hypothetical protein